MGPITFISLPSSKNKKTLMMSHQSLGCRKIKRRLVQAEHFAGFDRDLTVDRVDDKLHRGLPLVGYRQFDLLVDMPFEEAGTVSRAETLFGKQVEGRLGDLHD